MTGLGAVDELGVGARAAAGAGAETAVRVRRSAMMDGSDSPRLCISESSNSGYKSGVMPASERRVWSASDNSGADPPWDETGISTG